MKNKHFWVPIVTYALLLVSYFYILDGEFIGDDVDRIQFNYDLFSYVSALTGGLSDRPILMLFITTIAKIFGHIPLYFRLVGILFHVMVAYQLFLFLLELNEDQSAETKNGIAFVVSLLFALHPLHNQVITTSIQMGVSMAAFFGLLSLRFFFKNIDSFGGKKYFYSVFFLLCATLSKPIGIFIPFIFVGYWKQVKLKSFGKALSFFGYFAALSPIIVYYFFVKQSNQAGYWTSMEYFAMQTEMLFTYFRLILWPTNLHFFYDPTYPIDLWDILTWKFLALHILIVVISLKYLRNSLLRTLFICFYISFLPESGFFPINHIGFEHRAYFPMIFLFLFIGTILIQSKKMSEYKNVFFPLTIGILCLYLVFNQSRNVEVKTYRTWALNTLDNSVRYHYSNFHLNYLLARAGYNEDVDRNLQKYFSIYKDEYYEALADINSYFREKSLEKKKSFFPTFINYVNDPDLPRFARYFCNKLLLDWPATELSFRELIVIAKAQSYQLKIFALNPLYTQIVAKYSILARTLMRPENIEKIKEIDFEYSYLLRATQIYYFNQSIPGFYEELLQALNKNPDSAVLIDIKTKLDKRSGIE